MEQTRTSTAPGIPFVSIKLALSEDARASLEAVRAAEESARLRARRQTLHARLWFLVLLGAVALVAGSWSRLKQSLRARGSTAAAERPSSPPAQPLAASSGSALPAAAPSLGRPMPDPSSGSAPAPAPHDAPPAAIVGATAAKAGEPGDSDSVCDRAAVRTAPWRISPEACVRAFQADPTDATLALAIAQAEHAHGSHAEAAQWAKRALALDPNAAEAYVIVARADSEEGRRDEAREAYRRYLSLAPRGWHHAEARAALRSERSRGL